MKRKNIWVATTQRYRCFLKWWYPQNTPKWSCLVGKPMVVGYHHFLKPPYMTFWTIVPWPCQSAGPFAPWSCYNNFPWVFRKNSGENTPKVDGENNGKPLWKLDDWGGGTYFWKHPYHEENTITTNKINTSLAHDFFTKFHPSHPHDWSFPSTGWHRLKALLQPCENHHQRVASHVRSHRGWPANTWDPMNLREFQPERATQDKPAYPTTQRNCWFPLGGKTWHIGGGGVYILRKREETACFFVEDCWPLPLGFQTPKREDVFGPQKHTWDTFSGGIWKTRVMNLLLKIVVVLC